MNSFVLFVTANILGVFFLFFFSICADSDQLSGWKTSNQSVEFSHITCEIEQNIYQHETITLARGLYLLTRDSWPWAHTVQCPPFFSHHSPKQSPANCIYTPRAPLLQNVVISTLTSSVMGLWSSVSAEWRISSPLRSLTARRFLRKCRPPHPSASRRPSHPPPPRRFSSFVFSPSVFPSSQLGLKPAEFKGGNGGRRRNWRNRNEEEEDVGGEVGWSLSTSWKLPPLIFLKCIQRHLPLNSPDMNQRVYLGIFSYLFVWRCGTL